MSLTSCAAELRIGEGYMQKLFRRTKFWPVLRINQKAFYMGYDFETWKRRHWLNGKYAWRKKDQWLLCSDFQTCGV